MHLTIPKFFPLLSGVILLASSLLILAIPVRAAPLPQAAEPTPAPLSISDETCLSCHGQPGQTMPLGDGSTLDLFVDPLEHTNSVHGALGYACVQCHRDVGAYPHPAFSAQDGREVTLKLNESCAFCHSGEASQAADSVHAQALAAGKREAAACTDCHSAHAVQRLTNPETNEILPEAHLWIPQTCAKCHSAIYEKYAASVHGAALTEGNLDVPTCIDCHGVHNIGDPTTAAYRLQSPQICANCHTDSTRMAKYGLTTEVLDTYVADFHGTTVMIFEKQSPDAETNKPVCYDCHGVHEILRTDDPQKGLQVRENLLARCQTCHPDATSDFPASWMSHYYPSPEKYPIVYYVDLFYKFFIPLVLGGMGVMVVLDASRRVINRLPRKPHAPASEEPAAPQPEPDAIPTEADATGPLEPDQAAMPPDTARENPTPPAEIPTEASPPEKPSPLSDDPVPPDEPAQLGEEARHE
jgi:hypothetical protein